MTLRVWVNDKPVGRIEQVGTGMSFAYDADVAPRDAISLSMPPRVKSYDQHHGLLAPFDTNMPEGYLREVLVKYLAKSNGRSTSFEMLSLVGGNMIGRVRVLPEGQAPERRKSIVDLDDMLTRKVSPGLITEVMERYGVRSGVSGAMPKTLMNEEAQEDRRKTIQTREYILKFDAPDFPGLSLNEFWCLKAARAAGNETVEVRLGANSDMLCVRRFDAREDGERLGYEDAASLNGVQSEEKYGASIEKALFRTLPPYFGLDAKAQMTALYRQIVTSVAMRNGDAHLKNFGVLYDDAANGPVKLAPAFDIVTTTAYLRQDVMAMQLGGTTRWPKPAALELLGARAGLSRSEARAIMNEVADAVRATSPDMVRAFDENGMPDLGRIIAEEWNKGLTFSLGADPVPVSAPDPFRALAAAAVDVEPLIEDDPEEESASPSPG